jgi:hypothetical protein
MKKTFILYTDICKGALKRMNAVQAGLLFNMIVDYADGSDVTSCNDLAVDMAFEIIRAAIETNNRTYEEICEKRRANGRKGAEVTNSKKRQNAANADNNGKTRQMPNESANADNNGKNGMICNDMICNEIKDTNVSYDNLNKEESKDSLSSCELDFARLLDFFNSQLKKNNSLIPSIKQLSDARKKTLKARAREYGKEALVKVFQKAAVSDFLNGKNDRSFTASFDWLLKPTNFPKVLEGNYDNPVKDKPKDAITSNVNGLIEQVKQEQQQREDEKRERILETYQAAKQGDERSITIIEQMRSNGTLAKYNLK